MVARGGVGRSLQNTRRGDPSWSPGAVSAAAYRTPVGAIPCGRPGRCGGATRRTATLPSIHAISHPTLDSIATYVLISASSAPNRTFTAGKGAENHRRVERESVHTFYAFDAAINSYKKRSAGGDLNRADAGDLTSRANGEIGCLRTHGDGTRHKPQVFRAKRRPQHRPGREICLGARYAEQIAGSD